MVRLPARMRTWGKRGYGLLEDRVVVLRMCREQFAAAGGWAADDAASAARAASAFVARLICLVRDRLSTLSREHCSSLLS